MADTIPVERVVSKGEVHRFIVECMSSVGMAADHCSVLADVLVAADYRGHYSHGLNRLEIYMNDIKNSSMIGCGEPEILKQTPATALVDGKHLTGPIVGKFCTDLAIEKAKNVGIGWVAAKGSNHFGIAGWYSMRAMEQGLIGMAFTNTSPLVRPTRSKQVLCGTNPLSVAAPTNDGGFVLDMATSTVAVGKIEMAERKGTEIPSGWGSDKDGKETLDPSAVLNGGGLMPLGGSEETGGYKGYGLGMMVELFCGILSGSCYGRQIRRWMDPTALEPANLGQCFVAINPDMFADGFAERMTDFVDSARSSEKALGETEVLVAGDPERRHMNVCDDIGGIPYHPNQITHANEIAKQHNVEPMKISKTLEKTK